MRKSVRTIGLIVIIIGVIMIVGGLKQGRRDEVQATQVVGQPEVPVAVPTAEVSHHNDEVVAMVNAMVRDASTDHLVVHDVGAAVKMMPASKTQPAVVPESSVRKSP